MDLSQLEMLVLDEAGQMFDLRTNKDSCVIINNNDQGGNQLARSNYQSTKRQKELAKKKKKEEKRQRKIDKNTIKSEDNPNQSQNEGENL